MILDFYYTPSTCALGAHIALEEAGLSYTAHYVKLHDPAAQEAYRATVPSGKVPALLVDGDLLVESIGIIALSAFRAPEARLFPDDPLEKAQCFALLSWFASTMQLDRRQARAPFRFTADETTYAALSTAAKPRFAADVQSVEARLAGREWLIGDHFTAADGQALLFWDWALADGYEAAAMPNFTAHAHRVMARPAVQRVLEQERHPLFKRLAVSESAPILAP